VAGARIRLANNADGEFFVDANCINCGVSRHYAPNTFGDDGIHAFVKKQPSVQAETLAAQRAQLVFTPGHTRDHMVLLGQGTFLFVGDHFSPRSVCWFPGTHKLNPLKNLAI
jgi:glyoxylase-like metal-dependent hydrolase (beta-lactamase superfamily II)